MKKTQPLKYSLLLEGVWLFYLMLYPRKYDVSDLEVRENISYWKLLSTWTNVIKHTFQFFSSYSAYSPQLGSYG